MKVREAAEQVRFKLYGSYRAERNLLDIPMTDTATQLILKFSAQGASRGAYLGVGDEIMYSWGPTTQGSKSIVVQRGEFGTVPVAHAGNSVIEVNPRFPLPAIVDVLRDEILSWPDQLYRVDAVTVTPQGEGTWLGLGNVEGLIRPLRVLYRSDGGWRNLRKTWTLVNGLPAFDAPTTGIRLPAGSIPADAAKVSVLCARRFNMATFKPDTELVDHVGLSPTMLDLAVIGACWRLMSTREVQRTFIEAQGDSRRAEEVPPTHSVSTARSLEALRDARLQEEIARLVTEYGWRQR